MSEIFEKVELCGEKRAEAREAFEAVVRVYVTKSSEQGLAIACRGVLKDISEHGIGVLVSIQLSKGDRFYLEADFGGQFFPSVVDISPRGRVPSDDSHYVVVHCSQQPDGRYAVGAAKTASRS